MNKNNQLQIRNSTVEFLIFTKSSTGETNQRGNYPEIPDSSKQKAKSK